jgi:hypothetical protein
VEYIVEINFRPKHALTEPVRLQLVDLGGTFTGRAGHQLVEVVFTIEAADVRSAAIKAIDRVTDCVQGTVVAIQVLPVSTARGPAGTSSKTRENGKPGSQAASTRRRGSAARPCARIQPMRPSARGNVRHFVGSAPNAP